MKSLSSKALCIFVIANLCVMPCAAQDQGQGQSQDQTQRSNDHKMKHNKAVGCGAGALAGGLAGGLLKKGILGIVVGAAAGCLVGRAIAKELTKHEQEQLAQKTQEAFDDERATTTYQSADTNKTVTLSRDSEQSQEKDYELNTLANVESPKDKDFEVVGRTYYAKSAIRLRSSPELRGDNIIGSFKPNEAVFVMGKTSDDKWNVIGSDDVVVGYAARDLFATQPIPVAVAKKSTPAKPVMAKQVNLAAANVTKVKVKAVTSCAQMRQSVNEATGLVTGCKSPNGGWALS